jgi:hypothetical protein
VKGQDYSRSAGIAAFRHLPHGQDGLAEPVGPERRQNAVCRAGDRVFRDAVLRRKEAADEVHLLARCADDDAAQVQLAQPDVVRRDRANLRNRSATCLSGRRAICLTSGPPCSGLTRAVAGAACRWCTFSTSVRRGRLPRHQDDVRALDWLPGSPAACFFKHAHNAFSDTGLDLWLRRRGIDHLIVAGIRTEQCCETTTRVGCDIGYAIDFVSEATLTFPMTHPAAAASTQQRRSRRIANSSWPGASRASSASTTAWPAWETTMLELRPNCECCDRDLPPDSPQAMICSFECTFCADCATRYSPAAARTAAVSCCGGRFARWTSWQRPGFDAARLQALRQR